MSSTAQNFRGERLNHHSDWDQEPAAKDPMSRLEEALDHRDPSLKHDLAASATRELSHHQAEWLTKESWATDDSGKYSILKDTAAHALFHSTMDATDGAPDPDTAQKVGEAITGALKHSLEAHRNQEFPDDPPEEARQAVWSTSRILESHTDNAQRQISKALTDGDENAFAKAMSDLHETVRDLDHTQQNDATNHPFITSLTHRDGSMAQEVFDALDHRLQLRNNPDYSAVMVDPNVERFEFPQPSWLEGDQRTNRNLFEAYSDAVEGRSNAYTVETALQLAGTIDAGITAAVRRLQLLDPASKWNEPNIKGFNLDTWRSEVGPQLTDQRQAASENLAHALINKDEDTYHGAILDLTRIKTQVNQNLSKSA